MYCGPSTGRYSLWLLGPSGPLLGQARVQLMDKAYFLVSQLTEQLIGEPADDLYRAGRHTAGWTDFLAAANDLLTFYAALVIAHDRQTTLSPERIAQLQTDTALARLELVHSFTDPRIQVADFLAGVARKIASDQLKGQDDAELTALIRPYVDPRSIWGDLDSWQRLAS